MKTERSIACAWARAQGSWMSLWKLAIVLVIIRSRAQSGHAGFLLWRLAEAVCFVDQAGALGTAWGTRTTCSAVAVGGVGSARAVGIARTAGTCKGMDTFPMVKKNCNYFWTVQTHSQVSKNLRCQGNEHLSGTKYFATASLRITHLEVRLHQILRILAEILF